MQPSDMDKKREAFLEHLKQKYPHHASAIMGHQERLREQTRSPKHAPSPAPGVGEQAEQLSLASLESLDTMSEADAPTAFTRGSRSRASLPVVRSTNQTKDRSLGVLYLQYGDETKQIRMPNEITSGDTVRALFVGAFPQQLTMKMLESPSMAVYVKDDMRNMYYELSDVRNITDHSCLKVYHKDPAQAFSHGPRPTNGDARMHREMMYSGQHPLRQPPMVAPPHHPMQGSMSPPTPHSMPPSPSRIPFGPRQGPLPGSATVPRERLPAATATAGSTPTARSASPCPSAILERRDVKPDEDLGGGKSHSLTRASEGLYGDPYLLHEGGRMGLAAAHGPGGHPAPGDGAEHGLGGYHRASARPPYGGPPGPSDPMEHPSLYRQKSRNSQLPTLGSKTPPPSPHRMAEVRLVDVHGGPPVERASPVRQSFRKEEAAAKPRGGVGSPTVADLQGHGGHGPASPAGDPQTRQRMKAMEQQIASLTGLVQHALLKSPGSSGAEETPSERSAKTASPSHSAHSAGGSPILAPKSGAPPSEVAAAPLHASLLQFRRNVCDLRLQLLQMRQLQLQNQEALRAQLKRAEQEIGVRLAEAVRRLDDPAQRQRVQVEEDRHKYLGLEERVLDQLGELEQYVDSLKREPGVGGGNRSVTLRDVEEGAVSLRRVGESLAGLKGEFPALQTRMRAVLRVEVEAVKFLKEEPHKLDSMLKRVKSLTDILSSLRRRATEGQPKASDPTATPVEDGPPAQTPAEAPPPPQAAVRAASPSALPPAPSSPTPSSSSSSSSVRSEVVPASPVIVQRVQSSPVRMRRSQQSAALTAQPSPPATPSSASPTQGGRDSPGSAQAAAVSSSSFSSSSSSTTSSTSSEPPSPGQHKGNQPGNPEQQPAAVHSNGNANGNQSLFIEELHATRSKSNSRAMSIEAAEKEWEERRQNMGHYDGKEFEKILQEAQANMMKCIPSLEVVGGEGEGGPPAPPAAPGDQADGPKPAEPATAERPRSEPSSDKPGPEKPKPKPAPDKPAKPAAAERPPPKPAAAATADRVAKPGAERASKSPPPPPPPRKTFPLAAATGMTTTRSGEVVYTGRKEPVAAAQEGEEEAPPPPPKHKPAKPLPETTPKTPTPPPDAGPAPGEEEEEDDEGVKVMAELQVFQKCTAKGSKCTDAGVKGAVEPARIEPQVRVLTPLREKKSSESTREDKGLDTDENGNSTVRQSPGVIYYVTGQISKEQPTPPPPPTPPPHPGPEKATECREPPPMSPSQNASVASPTSRMPVPLSAKSRQSPGPTDKAGKQQKLQDAQRQFRQANGSAKRAGGDHKTTSPTLPASKIPAFYPSSAKGSPQSAPNSDATNPTNPSSSSSSSCSSPTAKSSIPSPHPARPGPAPSSHIPSLSNGSLKLPAPHPHAGKPLSFSSQTPNGRAPPSSPSSSSSFSSSSSSSSPSPLSPTPLGPGAKSIRTIHTPSFTSYRPHTSSNSKSCIQTATAAKDAT